jgi:carbon-monoxide dehydrogenase iron sulfur subunit
MKGLNIIPERCTGCMQCELACSYVKTGTFQPSRSLIRVHIFDELASYAPYTCFQCKEAWCMTACPTNAIAINPDTGAKVVLEQTCVGCSLCSIACPFGTVFYNPDIQKAYKCDLCSGDPACAAACPTNAIEYAEIGDSEAPWLGPWAKKLDSKYAEVLAGASPG